MADHNYVLVIAIDFGTTYSGYAFSFKSRPDAIKMNKNWGYEVGFQSYKTPTTVLVNGKQEFVAFGFEADQKYGQLKEEEMNHGKYSLYEKFKMLLHGTKVDGRNFLIYSTNGKIWPAIDIFAMALRHLKDHAIKAISLQLHRPLDENLIRWVLTVPAIWGDHAKYFMRKAAKQANLIEEVNSNKLMIALEPEAASLYCKTLEMGQFVGMETEEGKPELDVGTHYMVIDAGGGTVDIAVHKIEEGGKVAEVYKASGGPWGGGYVNALYESMLCDIFGEEFIMEFKRSHLDQWLEMMLQFERRKRAVQPGATSSTNIPITMAFSKEYEKFSGQDMSSAFTDESVTFSSSGMLRVSANRMESMFEVIISNIKDHLTDILQQQALHRVTHIFLVGGFGECRLLQKMISDNFGSGRTILIPEEASMSVLKGAVIHGHNCFNIASRISKYTYAVGKSRAFIPGQDQEKHMTLSKGTGSQRRSFLRVLVKAGDSIAPDTECSTIVHPHTPDKSEVSFVLYYSEDILSKDAHPTDPNVRKLYKLTIDSPDTTKGKDRKFKVTVTFGGTQLFLKVVEEGSDNEVATTINFDV